MEMPIDEVITQLSMQKFYVLGKDYEAVQVAIDTMRKYQMMQADHKAEMIDMLKEIREEIEDHHLTKNETDEMDEDSVKWGMAITVSILDKKISELEGKDAKTD